MSYDADEIRAIQEVNHFFSNEVKSGRRKDIARTWASSDASLAYRAFQDTLGYLGDVALNAKDALERALYSAPKEDKITYSRIQSAEMMRLLDLIGPSKMPSEVDAQVRFLPAISEHILYSTAFNTAGFLEAGWNPEIRLGQHGHFEKIAKNTLAPFSEPFSAILMKEAINSTRNPLDKSLTNDSKIGMASDIHLGQSSVTLFETCYFASVCTADWSTQDLLLAGQPKFRAGDRYPMTAIDDRFELMSIAEAARSVSYHVGASCLLLTSDNYLIFPRQKFSMNESGGRFMPSGSGSADWRDIFEPAQAKNFHDVISRCVRREVREELGQNAERQAKGEELTIEGLYHFGMFRGLRRGGKPDFVGFGKLNWPLKDLRIQIAELEGDEVVNHEGKVDDMNFRIFKIADSGDIAVVAKALLEGDASTPIGTSLGAILHLFVESFDEQSSRVGNLIKLDTRTY